MTMRNLVFVLILLLQGVFSEPSPAADWAWVLSVPHALSGENVYKVRILEIDGEPQKELIRYAVPGGSHTIKVRLLLQVRWDPEFAEAPPGPGVKNLELELEPGRSYFLAARVDPDAPVESQLDQSYWEPFVYRTD
jgi:hypothetical protein